MNVNLRKLLIVLVLLAALSVSAIQAQDEPTTLRVGTTYIMDSVNPANGFYGYNIRGLWHDTLIQHAGGDQFEPALAESWEVSDDGLTWTFKIREGVSFSDGTPLTAEDAAWSLNWVIDNEVSLLASYLSHVDSVEALDPTTLQITVDEPVADMISSKLLYMWIVPRSVWEGMDADAISEYDEFDSTTGSGPYKLVDFQEGEFLILEANESYWGGPPPVDRIIYQEYATEDALVQALLAGDIDLVTAVPYSGVSTLIDAENVTVSVGPDFLLEELIINSSPEGTQPASLNDPAVRLAIAHAVDKQQIVNVGYLGYADTGVSFLPHAYGDFFNSDIEDIPFDLDEGNRILDEAGFVDSDGDGVREYSDDTPLEFRLYAPDSEAYYARIIEIISNDLAEIGISAPPLVLSDDSLVALQVDYDNDMIYWGWGFDPDPSFALSIFTCDETVDGGWSDSGYCSEEFDALYLAQSVAVEHEARQELLWEAQQMIFDNRTYISVAYPQSISAYRNDRFTFAENLAQLPLRWALFHGFN